jgi:hypothetical protein
MKKRAIYLSALLLVSITQLGAAQSDPLPIANSTVVIEGRLKHKQVYGPPGFGETPHLDSKFTVYYVDLRRAMSPEQLRLPLTAKPSGAKTYSEVQLYCGNDFAGCDEFLRKHVNRNVLVSGSTAYALEPNDVYPVTMTVAAMDTK